MNIWKNFDIKNIPTDLFKEEYEFRLIVNGELDSSSSLTLLEILANVLNHDTLLYQYRKLEPKAPSHEEIMTKWWKYEDEWFKVVTYKHGIYFTSILRSNYKSSFIGREPIYEPMRFLKGWFILSMSADVPPEDK